MQSENTGDLVLCNTTSPASTSYGSVRMQQPAKLSWERLQYLAQANEPHYMYAAQTVCILLEQKLLTPSPVFKVRDPTCTWKVSGSVAGYSTSTVL